MLPISVYTSCSQSKHWNKSLLRTRPLLFQMAHSIPPLFSGHQTFSPWSLASSKDLSSKPSTPLDPLVNPKSTERSLELRTHSSIYPGSTPLSMPGSQFHGRTLASNESSRSLSVDNGRGAKALTGTSSHLSWNATPINAPYGIIGSNVSIPALPSVRAESQSGIPVHRQSVSASIPSVRTAVPARENSSQVPPAPLSAPPFQTSFFPLFGPPGTRQGFIMPGDWTINPNGFLISENARRLNAMALEVDQAELHRRVSSERKDGPAMGCRMCALVPRLMLFPCEHNVCSECGSRFVTASGGMYCSCGEVRMSLDEIKSFYADIEQLVSSMINLNIPRTWDLRPSYYMPILQHQLHPPPGLPGPVPVSNETPQPSVSFSPVPRQPPLAPPTTPQQRLVLPYSSATATKEILGATNLAIDAETAIENAPFVELGRHALAQNWCCVKISNVAISSTRSQFLKNR